MADIISEEQARKEVESWLDFRKVPDNKRKININSTNNLVKGIMEGFLVLDPEDFTFKQTLKFPIGDVKVLVYKPRLTMGEVAEKLIGVNPLDSIGNTIAYTAALTGQPTGIIKKIDTEDFTLIDHLSFFFMA